MSFDAKRTLEDLAGQVSDGYEIVMIRERGQHLARRRWLLRAVSIVPGVFLVVAGATLLFGGPANDYGETRQGRSQGLHGGATSSATPTRRCGWAALEPYLISLLESVGGPEDVTLNARTMSPTQNGIRLHPRAYEGRLDVYVTSDNEPDPQNANSVGMEVAAHHSGFTIYRNHNEESDVVLAVDDSSEWTMSLVAYPLDGSPVVWARPSSPVEWMKRANSYSNDFAPPEC